MNKLFTYKDFINESILGNAILNIKAKLAGSKAKIRENIRKIVLLEKDFIDKTDELSFTIYKSADRPTRNRNNSISVNPLLRQQALMNKRALEAARRSKDSGVNNLQTQIEVLIKGSKDLTKYYNSEATKADALIARYAYEKAKSHRDNGYADPYYNQYLELEELRKKLDTVVLDDSQPIDMIGGLTVPKPFNLKWNDFREYVGKMELADVVQSEGEGKALKLKVEREYKKYLASQRALKAQLRKENDSIALDEAELDEEEKKTANIEFTSDLENKLELLKRTKLKR